ncbi:MAG: hypothetical protein CM1200mP41_15930 [Gammaproteobacteria bacterium]|nr:MAG: hypothetical protein CM1200mP41_15930 [Gammaproteobacteria bacterium]
MFERGLFPLPNEFGGPGRGSNHMIPLFINMPVSGNTTLDPKMESKVWSRPQHYPFDQLHSRASCTKDHYPREFAIVRKTVFIGVEQTLCIVCVRPRGNPEDQVMRPQIAVYAVRGTVWGPAVIPGTVETWTSR